MDVFLFDGLPSMRSLDALLFWRAIAFLYLPIAKSASVKCQRANVTINNSEA